MIPVTGILTVPSGSEEPLLVGAGGVVHPHVDNVLRRQRRVLAAHLEAERLARPKVLVEVHPELADRMARTLVDDQHDRRVTKEWRGSQILDRDREAVW